MFFPLAAFSNSKSASILNRLLFVLGIVLFRCGLDLYYKVYAPLFSYLGFVYNPQNDLIYIATFTILIITATLLPLNFSKASNAFLLLLYLMSYLPIVVLYSYDANASSYGFLFYSFFIIFLSIFNKISFSSSKFRPFSLSKKSFNLLLFSMVCVCLAILINHYGVSFNVKKYADIYDVRDSFKELTNKSRLLVFSFNWMSHAFTIILLLIGLYYRKLSVIFLALIVQLYLFNLGGNKSIFLLPIFAMFVYFALAFFKEYASVAILYTFVFMCFGLYFYDFVINDKFSVLSSILIRRNFFVPANLFYYYIDFFSYNPHDFMAKSFPFNMFLESHYDLDIPNIIGTKYISPNGKMYANANFLSDLFLNFGWVGYGIGLVIFGFILKLIDRLIAQKNFLIVIPLFSITVISLMNSGLMVNLISFGLILILILITLFPRVNFFK